MKYPDDPIPLWRTAKAGSVLARSLSAARGRGPTGDQMRALERNVLIAIGGTAAAATGAAPGKAAATSPGGASTAGLSAAKLGFILVVSAAVVGTTAGVYWASRQPVAAPSVRASSFGVSGARVARSAPPASPAATRGAPLQPSAAAATSGATRAGSPAQAPGHLAPRATPRDAARAEVAAAATGSPDDVAELQLLSRARRALAADPALALALADEHQRRFTRGSMVQEREVIAVDALVGLGRLAEARNRGERLAREHAGSPYVARIQQILSRGAASE